MKLKRTFAILFAIAISLNGFSQRKDLPTNQRKDLLRNQREDPLRNNSKGIFKVKTAEEMAKNLKKLTGKSREVFEKTKNDYKRIKNPTFEIAPNEILNRNPRNLLGGTPIRTQDKSRIKKQNQLNKENETQIKSKLTALHINASSLTFNNRIPITKLIPCSWNTRILTPVRDQGDCGSCWAFTACAAFEHTYNKFYGAVLNISEQQVVACGKTCDGYAAGSCYGGLCFNAFDYMKCSHMTIETDYPYTATSTPCKNKPGFLNVYTWGQIYPNRFPTINEVKSYINMYGAVATMMKAGINTFISYGGGVYNGYPSTNPEVHDHEVIIVGWCDGLNAWIIKNSWGTDWGPYGGYAYVGYNQCNIGKYVYWVHPNKIIN